MGCGPQLAKSRNIQSAKAIEKKLTTNYSSFIQMKPDPPNTQEESKKMNVRNSVVESGGQSIQSIGCLNIESMVEKEEARAER